MEPQMLDTAAARLDFQVDRRSSVPLHVQIKHALLDEIRRRGPGEERFFTDDELTRFFNVSRMTVRHSINTLVNEGILERVHGVGTFIISDAVPGALAEEALPATAAEAPQLRSMAEARIVITAFEVEPSSEEIARQLDIELGAPVRHIQRVRSIGEERIGFDDFYVPIDFCSRLTRVNARNEILRHVMKRYTFYHLDMEMGRAWADGHASALLRVKRGSPLARVKMRFAAEDKVPVVFGIVANRSGNVRYALHTAVARDIRDPIDILTSAGAGPA
jgi:GntR family transcriptional regulator